MTTKTEHVNKLARATYVVDHILDQLFGPDDGSTLRAVAELATVHMREALVALADIENCELPDNPLEVVHLH